MSQDYFGTIDATTTSGTQLANILSLQEASLLSTSSGSSRPAQLVTGGLWIDDTNAPTLNLNIFDGSTDLTLATFNTVTNKLTFGNSDGSFTIDKTSDVLNAFLVLDRARLAGTGQTLTGDIIGEIKFFGRDDTGATVDSMARIEVVAFEDTTTGQHGSEIIFYTKEFGTTTETEVLRLNTQDSIGGGGIEKWTPTTDYETDDVVFEEVSNLIYRAITGFTSGATFNVANWIELSASSGGGAASFPNLDEEVDLGFEILGFPVFEQKIRASGLTGGFIEVILPTGLTIIKIDAILDIDGKQYLYQSNTSSVSRQQDITYRASNGELTLTVNPTNVTELFVTISLSVQYIKEEAFLFQKFAPFVTTITAIDRRRVRLEVRASDGMICLTGNDIDTTTDINQNSWFMTPLGVKADFEPAGPITETGIDAVPSGVMFTQDGGLIISNGREWFMTSMGDLAKIDSTGEIDLGFTQTANFTHLNDEDYSTQIMAELSDGSILVNGRKFSSTGIEDTTFKSNVELTMVADTCRQVDIDENENIYFREALVIRKYNSIGIEQASLVNNDMDRQPFIVLRDRIFIAPRFGTDIEVYDDNFNFLFRIDMSEFGVSVDLQRFFPCNNDFFIVATRETGMFQITYPGSVSKKSDQPNKEAAGAWDDLNKALTTFDDEITVGELTQWR